MNPCPQYVQVAQKGPQPLLPRTATNVAIPPPRLHPGEPGAHPQHQLIKLTPPAIQVYPEPSGHRAIF